MVLLLRTAQGIQLSHSQPAHIDAGVDAVVGADQRMDFSDDTDLLAVLGDNRAAARMEGRIVVAGLHVIVLDAQRVEQIFHHALEGEEVSVLAVHTQNQVRHLVRQLLARNRDVLVADLVQRNRAVAVVVVLGQNQHHRRNRVGTHDAGVLAQRVEDDNRLALRVVLRQADAVVLLGADKGVGHDLIHALRQHVLVDGALKLLVVAVAALRIALGGGGWDVVVAVEAGDLLRHVGLVLHVAAEGWDDDVLSVDSKLQVFEDLLHLLAGDVGAQEGVDPGRVQVQDGRLIAAVVHVDDAVHNLTGAQLLDQLAGAHDGRQAVLRVEALLKAAGRLGSHAQLFCGDAHRAALKAGGLEDDGVGALVDAAVLAAHDAGYRAGLFLVGDDQHLLAQGSVHAVQCLDGLAGAGVADNDLVALDILDVKGVHRLAVLEHDVVGDVDDVVDRAHAAGAQTLAHPARGRADLDIFDDSGHIALAELLVLHLNREIVVDVAAAALDLRLMEVERLVEGGRRLAGKTDDRQAVRAVRGDLKLDGGVVAAQRRGDVLADLAVLLDEEDAVLDGVREVAFGQAQLTQRAEHAVGHHASELALGDLDAVWQLGFVQGHRHDVACMDVGRASHNLHRLPLADIQLADHQMVGVRVLFHRQNLADHYVFDLIKFGFPAFYLRAGHTHCFGEIPHRDFPNIDIIFQPSHRKIHRSSFLSWIDLFSGDRQALPRRSARRLFKKGLRKLSIFLF